MDEGGLGVVLAICTVALVLTICIGALIETAQGPQPPAAARGPERATVTWQEDGVGLVGGLPAPVGADVEPEPAARTDGDAVGPEPFDPVRDWAPRPGSAMAVLLEREPDWLDRIRPSFANFCSHVWAAQDADETFPYENVSRGELEVLWPEVYRLWAGAMESFAEYLNCQHRFRELDSGARYLVCGQARDRRREALREIGDRLDALLGREPK